MKLASLKGPGRDGTLCVVSRDLARAAKVDGIAPTLQQALENWPAAEAKLRDAFESLQGGHERHAFDLQEALTAGRIGPPLPRAYEWLDGSAYLTHVERVRRARNDKVPESFYSDPLMYQGGAGSMMGPRDPIRVHSEDWGVDLEGEVVAIVGDVPMGASPAQASAAVRLLTLVNDVSFRRLIPAELAKGFGFVQSKPASALSPVFVTPDALGDRWADGKLKGELAVQLNGQDFGKADAGTDMTFDFGTLIAHLAKTRSLCAGTIIGSGTVSNRDADGGPGKPVSEGGLGYSCIAEVRTVETILRGKPETSFLKHGDTVRIEVLDDHHHSIFGAIEQTVEPA